MNYITGKLKRFRPYIQCYMIQSQCEICYYNQIESLKGKCQIKHKLNQEMGDFNKEKTSNPHFSSIKFPSLELYRFWSHVDPEEDYTPEEKAEIQRVFNTVDIDADRRNKLKEE